MIFLICVLTFAIAVSLALLESKKYILDRNDGIEILSWTIIIILGIVFITTGGMYLTQDFAKQNREIKYETLNNDKDNPYLGEKIAEYNEEILRGRRYQEDFWIGPFIPNIYDDMKLIEINGY